MLDVNTHSPIKLLTGWQKRWCRVVDHWEVITQDPMKPDSPSNVIMLDVRKRKGLKEQPNAITEYEDKL